MTPEEIHRYIMETCAEVRVIPGPGQDEYFYNPEDRLEQGTHMATLKRKDGKGDKASRLDRGGLFRLDLGVPRETYVELFGRLRKTPSKGDVIAGPWDFTMIDTLMPHPSYGWDGWVSVINPSAKTFQEECRPLIGLAYARAVARFNERMGKNAAG